MTVHKPPGARGSATADRGWDPRTTAEPVVRPINRDEAQRSSETYAINN